MKKKIICMLLAGMLSVSISTNYVLAESAVTEEGSNTIVLTADNSKPVIYDADGLNITVEKKEYDSNWGNPFYKIYFMVDNSSDSVVRLSMDDSSVDNFAVPTYVGNSSINPGKKGIVDFSIWKKDYEPYDIKNFDIWESTLTISKDGDEIAEYTINAKQDIFTSIDGVSDAENNNQASSSSDDSDTENDVVELQNQIESLTLENTELKDKVSSLKSENEKLSDENKNLKDENDKLKKENEELKSNQTTPTPEATPIPEATQPVTEYKDATTIRITQQALNEAGYNCGNPDGVAGGKTSQAITSYQTAKGITVNGLVTDELLQSLGIVEKVQEAVKAEGAKNEYSADYSYDQLARNPDTYIGQKVKITGKVLQAESGDDICYARVAMNSNYDTVVFVTYDKDLLGYRLLEDDIITVYGTACSTYSYKAVSGATITIPWLHADIIEM